MKKNKLTIYLTFVIILFVCVLYVSLKDDYKDILNALNDVNILFLLIGVFFMFLSKYFLGETLYFLAKKEKSDIKIKDMVLIELIYPFFAGITPSSLGCLLYTSFRRIASLSNNRGNRPMSRLPLSISS